MSKRHLGVVLLVPEPVATEIDGLRRACGDTMLGRVPAHITVVPPVNVAADAVDDAVALLRVAARSVGPLRLTLGPPATFLPDAPVVYLAVGGDVDAIRGLREAVYQPPLTRRRKLWPFAPHCTIADEMAPERIPAAVAALADYRVEVEIRELHLLEEAKVDGHRVWRSARVVPLAGASGAGIVAADPASPERAPEGAEYGPRP